MKNHGVRHFLGYFLFGVLLTWLILTVGILLRGGHLHLISENLPRVLGVYLLAGLICGLCFASFFNLLRKNKRGK